MSARYARHVPLALGFGVALLLASGGAATAQVIITKDTTWRLADSPIVLPAGASVQPPVDRLVTLTIEPGVVVRVGAGASISLAGTTLVARGTATAPIRFTSSDVTVTPGAWRGISLNSDAFRRNSATYDSQGNYVSGSILEHVIIEGAGAPWDLGGALVLRDVAPFIRRAQFRLNLSAAITVVLESSQPWPTPPTLKVVDSTLTGTGSVASINDHGIYISSPRNWRYQIEGNVITGFRLAGIYVTDHNAVSTGHSTVHIRRNTLSGNGSGGDGSGVTVWRTFGDAHIASNTISGNGRGIHANVRSPGSVVVTGNTVHGNTPNGGMMLRSTTSPTDSLGAPCCDGTATITVSGNTVTGNMSHGIGTPRAPSGIFAASNGRITIAGNVIADNFKPISPFGSLPSVPGAIVIEAGIAGGVFGDNAVAANIGPSHLMRASATAGAGLTINGNTFADNAGWWTTGQRVMIAATGAVTLANNNFIRNATPFAELLAGPAAAAPAIAATGNWWGTFNPAVIALRIYDAADDSTRSYVDASSPLTAPDVEPPISPPGAVHDVRSPGRIILRWNPNAEGDVAGYRVWYAAPGGAPASGTGANEGASPIDVGAVTQFALTGVPDDTLVWVTAYDAHRDGTGDQIEGHESWFTIATVNRAPVVLTPPANQFSWRGDAASLQLFATDPDGDEITYGATGLPAGVTLDVSTGQIAGTISSTGNYSVTVSASDGIASDSRTFTWVVTPRLGLTSLTADRASPQAPGSSILFTAAAAGGVAPYQYKWWLYNGTSWTAVKDWSSSNSFLWTPVLAGDRYRVAVWVRNSGSSIDAPDNSGSNGAMSYVIGSPTPPPLRLLALTANRTAPQAVGTAITFTAAATGGTTPYQYKWWVFDGSSWSSPTGWQIGDTFTWTPSAAHPGSRVAVWIRNAGSTGDTFDGPLANSASAFPITSPVITPLRLTSLTADRTAPQPTGTAITLTAAATGGTAPYQYKWWLFDGTTWAAVTGWQTGNTLTWTPTTAHAGYRVGVWVRNAGSTADLFDGPLANSAIAFPIGGAPLTLTALTSNLASPQAVGTPITVTAAASGGTGPYQYKWWLFDGTSWTAVTGWQTGNALTWTPASAYSGYRIGVWIRNAGSTADVFDNPRANGAVVFAIQ